MTPPRRRETMGRPVEPGSHWSPRYEFNVVALVAAYIVLATVSCAWLSDEPTGPLYRVAGAIESVIPSVGALSDITLFPAAARKTLALLWILLPPVTLAASLFPGTFRPDIELLRRRPWYFPAQILVLLLPLVLVIRLPVEPSDIGGRLLHERLVTRMHESRIWFGAVTGFYLSVVSVGLALSIRVVQLARRVLRKRTYEKRGRAS